jgi:hypothetical protein
MREEEELQEIKRKGDPVRMTSTVKGAQQTRLSWMVILIPVKVQ